MQYRAISIDSAAPGGARHRIDALAGIGQLTCLPGPELTAVTELAKRMLGSDMSAFSVLDRDWQWLTARCGMEGDRLPREHRFCGRVVDTNKVVLVPDTLADPAYRDHPLVVGAPHVRAYAGVPVVMLGEDGSEIVAGSLCVVYRQPRTLAPAELATLRELATITAALVSSRLMALELAELAARRQDDLDRLARTHRQLGQAERIAGIGSWRLDIATQAIDWSDQVYAIHDLPLTETPPLAKALSFYPSRARRTLADAIALAIEQGRPFDEEVDFVSARGTPKRVRCMGEMEARHGEPVALIGVFQDISRQYEMEQALRRTADTDELTGLANRAGFNRAFARQVEAAAGGAALTLLLIDLDGFKAVNDRCGHLRGDQVLQTIAAVLHAPYLAACVCARLGGDEFGVIVPGVGDDGVDALVDRLIRDLRHDVEVGDGTMLRVSGTIGISRFEHGSVERDLLRRADVALYHGKHGGRGVAIRYAPGIDPELSPAAAPAAHPHASR